MIIVGCRSLDQYIDRIGSAVDEINAGGGINGRKVEVVVEDEANDPSRMAEIAQKFVEAQVIFEELADDPPAQLYVERCKYFEKEPPGSDWDGVWHMKEK